MVRGLTGARLARTHVGLVTWLVFPCGLETPEPSSAPLLPHDFITTCFMHLSPAGPGDLEDWAGLALPCLYEGLWRDPWS